MTLINECDTHVKLLKEAIGHLNSSTPSDIIERWKKHCKLTLKTLRKVLKNRTLKVSQKQRVLHLTARVESMHVKLDALMKKGGALTDNLRQRVILDRTLKFR